MLKLYKQLYSYCLEFIERKAGKISVPDNIDLSEEIVKTEDYFDFTPPPRPNIYERYANKNNEMDNLKYKQFMSLQNSKAYYYEWRK